jgi:hypothetical protein
MTIRQITPINPDSTGNRQEPIEPDAESSSTGETPTASIDELARLVDDGQTGWPQDLPRAQQHRLTTEVRRRRRSRLIQITARLIADDLDRDPGK